MTYGSWDAWRLDLLTWLWIGWGVQFIVYETIALRWYPGQELTAHLRPIFLAAPVTWYLLFGLWLWIGPHLLAPALERAFLHLMRG